MDTVNRFKAFCFLIFTKIFQLLRRAAPLVVAVPPPIVVHHEVVDENYPQPAAAQPVGDQHNLDWAMIIDRLLFTISR
ncbi:hypothetical protein Pint_16325 [Pistacia integerrima]|uniref:Uncharacterized protein n=1 Tax=Pistacia integerrima TaxID=434235 RepID=A0ACC0ZBF7_9ROSI|nr:hypothetical protein Pint_16325 [Pistacia integerrima]